MHGSDERTFTGKYLKKGTPPGGSSGRFMKKNVGTNSGNKIGIPIITQFALKCKGVFI